MCDLDHTTDKAFVQAVEDALSDEEALDLLTVRLPDRGTLFGADFSFSRISENTSDYKAGKHSAAS